MKCCIGLTCLSLLLFLAVAPGAAAEEEGDLHVTLHLGSGAKIKGIVRSGLEILEKGSFRPATDKDDPRVGYRVWYSTGTNGFIFVPHRDIVRFESRGPVTNEQRKQLEEALARLKEMAEKGRAKATEDLTALKKRQKAAAEEAKASEQAKAAEANRAKEDEAARKRKALLERFPPSDWTPDRRDEIERNRTILGVAPSAEEQDWLDSYDAWKEAVAIAKKEEEAARKKEAESKDGDGGTAKKPEDGADE